MRLIRALGRLQWNERKEEPGLVSLERRQMRRDSLEADVVMIVIGKANQAPRFPLPHSVKTRAHSTTTEKQPINQACTEPLLLLNHGTHCHGMSRRLKTWEDAGKAGAGFQRARTSIVASPEAIWPQGKFSE